MRSLRLRALVAVAIGAAAVAIGVCHREPRAEVEREELSDSVAAPADQSASIPIERERNAVPARNLVHTSTTLREVSISVSSEGSPVSRYELTIDRKKRASTENVVHMYVDGARGRQGRVELRPGSYALHVVGDAGSASLAFDVADGSNEPVEVTLAPFGSVRGMLVDARSLRPIQGELEFRVIPKDTRTGRSLTSSYLNAIIHKVVVDEYGVFTLRKIESGNIGLELHDPVTERPIWIMQRDESGALVRDSGYLGELRPGEEMDLGVVRGKRGYGMYR